MKPAQRYQTERTLALFLITAISVAAILYFYLDPLKTGDAAYDNLCAAVVPRFFVCTLMMALVSCYSEKLFAFPRVGKRELLWCLPPLLVAVVNFPFSALIGGGATLTHTEHLPLFLLKCILIGLGEELLFRGVLFTALCDAYQAKRGGCILAVLFSSAIFGAFHLLNLLDGAGFGDVLLQTGYSFLIGAMLATVFLKTDNLWFSVILHTLFDIGGFIIFDLGEGNGQDLVFWILTVIAGVACGIHIVFTLLKTAKKKAPTK